jgi:hypothetical protein
LSKRIFGGLVGFLLMLASFLFLRVARSTGQTEIAIVNIANGTNSFVFYTNSTQTGDGFQVDVKVCNVVDLKIWMIKLSFDPMLLRCTGAQVRWWPHDLPREWPPPPPIIDDDLGYVIYGDAFLFPNYPGLTGNMTLCSISFQIIRAPTSENETLACDLTFVDYPAETFLINSQDEDISFSIVNGYYELRSPPRLTGDINLDGVVDMRDINDVVAKYGTTSSSPDWDSRMDMNADLRVDLRDIGSVCVQFGKTW